MLGQKMKSYDFSDLDLVFHATDPDAKSFTGHFPGLVEASVGFLCHAVVQTTFHEKFLREELLGRT
jgi:hypothetical protein